MLGGSAHGGPDQGVVRPVPKRARDPLATGAIFRASPAALRSPMPRLLSPQSRVVSSAADGPARAPASEGGQPHGVASTAGRFGHLSSRFDELYTRSPTPKVLLSRMGKPHAEPLAGASSSHVALSSSLGPRGSAGTRAGSGDATFVTPSPRAPAAKRPVANATGAASDGQARKGGRNAAPEQAPSRDRAKTARAAAASPPDMSSDMDIDDLEDETPDQQTGRKGSRRGASAAGTPNSSTAASLRKAPLKEAPRASSADATHAKGADASGSANSSASKAAVAKKAAEAKAAEATPAQVGGVVTGGRMKRKAAILTSEHDEGSAAAAEANARGKEHSEYDQAADER